MSIRDDTIVRNEIEAHYTSSELVELLEIDVQSIIDKYADLIEDNWDIFEETIRIEIEYDS